MTTLLTTKLYRPSPRPDIVPRPRLIEQLNTGLSLKFALISAPAGFGKTTLVSAWAKQVESHTRVAWLSLDEGDNDLARFLTYFVAALQTIDGGVGQGVLVALQSPGAVNIEVILTTLINELAELPGDVVLILDDYQVIESQPIDQVITFLLDHLPVNVHLVVASRIDPSLPLSRLRARAQMTEIRADDLRFTADEAAVFLNHFMGFELSTQDIAALEERTEGWIAGLQMAGLTIKSLKQRDDIANFVHRFTGSDHYIQDYLTDEVLQQQSKEIRDFLLQTSILNRFCATLCDAVRFCGAESQNSQEILESLEASNLFIVPLDNERHWYRYHHLFADLLQVRLKRSLPDRLINLHLRASEWFEEHGFMTEAVDHAFSGEDFDRAANLIEQVVSDTMLHGRLTTILEWLDALPEGMLDDRPRLRFYQAWSLAMAGQPKAADKRSLDAKSSLKRLPKSPRNLALRGELAAMRTGIIIHHNDPVEIIQEAEEALAYLPEENLISRARVYMALGTAYAYSNEMRKAIETYERGRDLALFAKNPFLASANIELLTEPLVYHQGRLKDATENLSQILELGKTKDGTHHAFTGAAHILLAEINLEWSNFKAASRYLERGFELLKQGGIGYTLTHCYCAAARIKLAFGETDRAIEYLNSATQAAQASPLMHFQIRNLVCQVNLALYLEDTKTAFQWAAGENCELPEVLPYHLHELQQISLARVYFALGELEKTIKTLNRIQPQATSAGRMAHVIDIFLLKARALQEQSKSAESIECLERALSLAEPEGYVQSFVDYGEPMAQLLTEAAFRGIMPDYTGKLLAAFESDERDDATPPYQPLVEPLSPRELEVLHLIAKGLSNREISERLYLALDTVKGHNHRIYGKLGVHRRTEAIARASELGFL